MRYSGGQLVSGDYRFGGGGVVGHGMSWGGVGHSMSDILAARAGGGERGTSQGADGALGRGRGRADGKQKAPQGEPYGARWGELG